MVHVTEAIAALVVLICAADGWRRGLLLKLFGLVRFIVVIALTIVLTPLLRRILPLEPGIREGAAALGALVIAVVVTLIITRILHLVDRIPVLNTINRLGGAAIGAVFGILAIWLAILVIAYFPEVGWCKTVTGYVHESPVLLQLAQFNPLSLFS